MRWVKRSLTWCILKEAPELIEKQKQGLKAPAFENILQKPIDLTGLCRYAGKIGYLKTGERQTRPSIQ